MTDVNKTPKTAITATGIHMGLTGAGLTFYIDAGCVYPIKGVYIGAGTSTQSFYFMGTTKGSALITASPMGVGGSTQTETVD